MATYTKEMVIIKESYSLASMIIIVYDTFILVSTTFEFGTGELNWITWGTLNLCTSWSKMLVCSPSPLAGRKIQ